MIKITYKQLRDPRFFQITNRIYKSKMPIQSAKRLLSIFSILDFEMATSHKLFLKFADEHLDMITEGNFKPKEGPEHEAAIAEFLSTPVEIQHPRISAQELFHVELSPDELALLEGLIDLD